MLSLILSTSTAGSLLLLSLRSFTYLRHGTICWDDVLAKQIPSQHSSGQYRLHISSLIVRQEVADCLIRGNLAQSISFNHVRVFPYVNKLHTSQPDSQAGYWRRIAAVPQQQSSDMTLWRKTCRLQSSGLTLADMVGRSLDLCIKQAQQVRSPMYDKDSELAKQQ